MSMYDDAALEHAYAQGKEAANAGKRDHDNPYDEATDDDAWWAWSEGFDSCYT